ncbi:MAG: hypothetical protein ACREB8_10310, partial [Pseudolabrys sp.]
ERSLEVAQAAGVIAAGQEQAKPKRSLLARIFGIGKDEDEDEVSERPAPKEASKRARTPMATASLSSAKPVAVARIAARPKTVAVAMLPRPRPAEQNIATAAPPGNAFNSRGNWLSAIAAGPALPAAIAAGTPYEMAALDPASTGSTAADVLAYAAESNPRPAAKVRPMGTHLPRLSAEARVVPVAPDTSMAVKPSSAATLAAGGGVITDGPWLRATLLTPSVRDVMTANRVGAADPRWQGELLHKPAQSVMMIFSADPHLGMVTDRFSGSAVVFMATVTFRPQTTASLR